MKYICQYCEKEFNSKLGKTVHENSCKKNPNRIQKIYPTKKCQYCGKEFTVLVIKHHEETCECNPNKIEYHKCHLCGEKYIGDKRLHLEKFHNYNIEKNVFICPYCGNEFKQQFSLKRHINKCPKNPNIVKESKCNQKFIKKIKDLHPDLLNHIEILGIFYNGEQKTIKVKCKYCGEIYNEELNNIIRIGSWKCKNHCSQKIRRQNELNQRKENLIKEINEKNPIFLQKFEIVGNWDGQLRTKIDVKCKKCGITRKFLYNTILTTSTYSCKGCTLLQYYGFNKLILTQNEVINWLKQYKPNLLGQLDILDKNINLMNKKIKCKCLQCNSIINISLRAFFRKDTKNIMCPSCQKRHNESVEILINLINSHKIKKEKYICKYCGKECKNLNGLKGHEIRCKLNPNKLVYNKKWLCPYCGKEFNNPQAYAGHKTMCIQNPNWEKIKIKRYYGK